MSDFFSYKPAAAPAPKVAAAAGAVAEPQAILADLSGDD